MTRTWEDNCKAINGLWPHCEWTDEQRSLWRDDLSHLDQDVLHEALREVKRTHDSLYPQLPWVIEAYRSIVAAPRSGSPSWTRSVRPPVSASSAFRRSAPTTTSRPNRSAAARKSAVR